MSLNSTLFHGSFQLVGQQWWPIHYSIDSNFKHRSSRRCHIQHNDLSAASLSLLIALLRSLPDGPFLVSSFYIDCTGNRLQPTSTENSREHLPLPLQSTMRYAYLCFFLFCVFSQFSPCGTVFERWTLILRLIVDQFTWYQKKNVLSRFNRSSNACSLSSNDVSLAAIVSAIVSPWSQIWSFFTSCLMVVSFFSPPPARQPAPAGLCQIVYYISPESELLVLGILIEFVQLSLSFHTA